MLFLHHKVQQTSCLLKLVSAIFHYFWKNKVLLGYFERNTLKTNLTYSCFIFPLFNKHLFSAELPHAAHLHKISCFEKITVCVIETMLVTLHLSRWIKHEEKWTNKSSTYQEKIAIDLKTYLNDWKKYHILPLFKL